MTKLFSMKTLAFAGAAAFALTLAAAPQVSAAEDAKIAFDTTTDKNGKLVDNVSIDAAYVKIAASEANIVNGKIDYYYSSVKSGEPKKWKAVSTKTYRKDGDFYIVTVPVNEISKNKAAEVYIAADAVGTLKVGPIKCSAAPKLKATINNLASGPSITLMDGRSELNTGYISVRSQYSQYSYSYSYSYDYDSDFAFSANVESLKDGKDEYVIEQLQNLADFGGGTVIVEYRSNDTMTPLATAKLKVPGVANAPKVGLKLAKGINLNVKDTMSYRTFKVSDGDAKAQWVAGTGKVESLETIFGKDNVVKTGDIETLENNMKIQIKTNAKGKKLDSKIGTTTVYASAAAPTATNVKITNQVTTGKNPVTNASITFSTTGLTLTQAKSVSNSAIAVLEYKTKGSNKWTEVKSNKPTVTIKNNKLPDEIYVRVKATDESAKKGKEAAYEVAGHVMTITVNKQDPASSIPAENASK